ncbi:MAG TPA: dienelactone hydrolase family protein [Thermomicrobiales bacterium]|nr:dienelactone hydrolase family protein [Thermomicrobiales bacterium]
MRQSPPRRQSPPQPERPPLNQFQNYLVHEFVDDYNDGVMGRRDMMRRVLHITGGVAAAATTLTTLGVRAADAGVERKVVRQGTAATSPISVPADDPRVVATDITFDSSGVTITAYEARPSGTSGTPAATPISSPEAGPVAVADGGLPLILVCHENRGLTDHIRDVTRRLATNGYVAVAVDLVSRDGGTAAHDESEIPSILSNGDPNRHVEDFRAALAHYGSVEGVDATRAGMVGFCFGGGITWRAVTQIAELKAGVPYYGPPPPLEDVPNIAAAVLGVYSSDPGDFANEGRDQLEAALESAGVTFRINVYPGTEHAFNNDTGPRYNEEQALAAWQDTLDWFSTYV